MIERSAGPIQIAIPRAARLARIPGVCQFRRDLLPGSVMYVNGLPVVGRAAALLDHLATQSVGAGLPLADRAVQQGWLTEVDIRSRLSRPLKGNRRIREIVAGLLPGAEAESERRLQALLRRAAISGWTANFRVEEGGRTLARVDVAFPLERIAIEVDGVAYHSAAEAFQRDRTRQNELVRLGWTVLRFTWTDIVERPEYVVRTIRSALAACGAI